MNDGPVTSLSDLLKREDILVGLRTETLRDAVYRLLAAPLTAGGISAGTVDSIVATVMKREGEGSTCVPPVALPHGRTSEVTRIFAGLGINPEGVIGERPEMKIVLAFVSPADASSLHLRFLSGVAQLLRRENVVANLLLAGDGAAALEIIRAGVR